MYKEAVFERASEFLKALKHDPLFESVRKRDNKLTVIFDGHNLRLQLDGEDLHVRFSSAVTQEELIDELLSAYGVNFYWT